MAVVELRHWEMLLYMAGNIEKGFVFQWLLTLTVVVAVAAMWYDGMMMVMLFEFGCFDLEHGRRLFCSCFRSMRGLVLLLVHWFFMMT